MFDAASGEQVMVIRANEGRPIFRVAFSPDGTMLASQTPNELAGEQGMVRVWALDIDDLLEIARRNVTRSLTDDECRRYLHPDHCRA
jgi:WD40 repeat protein